MRLLGVAKNVEETEGRSEENDVEKEDATELLVRGRDAIDEVATNREVDEQLEEEVDDEIVVEERAVEDIELLVGGNSGANCGKVLFHQYHGGLVQ